MDSRLHGNDKRRIVTTLIYSSVVLETYFFPVPQAGANGGIRPAPDEARVKARELKASTPEHPIKIGGFLSDPKDKTLDADEGQKYGHVRVSMGPSYFNGQPGFVVKKERVTIRGEG